MDLLVGLAPLEGEDNLDIYFGQEGLRLENDENLLRAKLNMIEQEVKEDKRCEFSDDVQLKVPFTFIFAGRDIPRVHEYIITLLRNWQHITSDSNGLLLQNLMWIFMREINEQTISKLLETIGDRGVHLRTRVPTHVNNISNSIVIFDKILRRVEDQVDIVVLRAICEHEEVLPEDFINDLQFN